MKRRSFVKQSVSAAVLTPLAFSGLINAAGATEGGTENTEGTVTTVPETTPGNAPCERGQSTKYKYKVGITSYCYQEYVNAADGRVCFWDDHVCSSDDNTCSGLTIKAKPDCI